MFYTPKPRQYHYKPRFYDPEREDWELLKAKYNLDENGNPRTPIEEKPATVANDQQATEDQDLEYFQRRLREIERKEREEKQKIGLADLFRKRERPQFHYVSRFDENGNLKETTSSANGSVKKRITRRFDEDEMDRFKPVPAGKIMVYTLLVCVLLYLVFA
ncbi:MAG: hypothetical protein IJK99_00415 [Bacteroidales bacterium]|nr:hypothetical protein [Bacteroidales bacterium]